MARIDRRRRYDGLIDWLRTLPAEQQSVTLTFTEIERLIGHPLPPSAATSDYWSKLDARRAAAQRAGFRGRLDRPARSVRFVRVQG
jgi:hypothetical protein